MGISSERIPTTLPNGILARHFALYITHIYNALRNMDRNSDKQLARVSTFR